MRLSLFTGFPWNWVSALGVKYYNDKAAGQKKMFDDNFNHLDTVNERGGQTNGQPLDDSKDWAEKDV